MVVIKCYIKKNDGYFDKNIGFQNHWVYKENARIFDSVCLARECIKKYNLKNIVIEKIR